MQIQEEEETITVGDLRYDCLLHLDEVFTRNSMWWEFASSLAPSVEPVTITSHFLHDHFQVCVGIATTRSIPRSMLVYFIHVVEIGILDLRSDPYFSGFDA
jgi:hypothetical protein